MRRRPIDPDTHAVLDHRSRLRKAEKVRQLLATRKSLKGCSVLDVGTGTGVMAHYLLAHVGSDGRVTGVDTEDQRAADVSIEFRQVESTALPFPDKMFDIVVTNHVIEHVGDRSEQKRHLDEIFRVLATDGLVYLAQPNRWAIIEPHYLLPFLSWLPKRLADRYMKWFGRGSEYDCTPRSRRELRRMAEATGFEVEDVTGEAFQHLVVNESPRLYRMGRWAPRWVFRWSAATWCIPTLVMILSKRPVARTSA